MPVALLWLGLGLIPTARRAALAVITQVVIWGGLLALAGTAIASAVLYMKG